MEALLFTRTKLIFSSNASLINISLKKKAWRERCSKLRTLKSEVVIWKAYVPGGAVRLRSHDPIYSRAKLNWTFLRVLFSLTQSGSLTAYNTATKIFTVFAVVSLAATLTNASNEGIHMCRIVTVNGNMFPELCKPILN